MIEILLKYSQFNTTTISTVSTSQAQWHSFLPLYLLEFCVFLASVETYWKIFPLPPISPNLLCICRSRQRIVLPLRDILQISRITRLLCSEFANNSQHSVRERQVESQWSGSACQSSSSLHSFLLLSQWTLWSFCFPFPVKVFIPINNLPFNNVHHLHHSSNHQHYQHLLHVTTLSLFFCCFNYRSILLITVIESSNLAEWLVQATVPFISVISLLEETSISSPTFTTIASSP